MKVIVLAICVVMATVLGIFLWGPAKQFVLQNSCLDGGGKWATNGNYCIRQDCALNSSCKPSYSNNSVCASLDVNISREELYFQLGMPESNNGSIYTFAGGAGKSKIKAAFENNKVSELNCGI